MEVPTQELHRRPTLSHFMSRVESSSNLRDLLKVRQDDAEAAAAAARRRGAEATRTLATILACEKRDLSSDPSSSSSSVSSVTRTLLDIIRDEQEPNNRMMPNGAVGSEGLGGGPGGNRGGGGGAVVVNWKALRDRLRLRRANEVLQASAALGEGSQRREEEEQERGTSLQPVSGAEGPRPLVSILEAAPAPPAESPAAPQRAAPTTTAGATTSDDTASTSTPRSQEGQPRVTNPPAASSDNRPQPPPPARQPRPQQPRQRPPQTDEPTRVSLMALLEQADRTGGGVGGPSYAAAVVGLVEDAHGEEGHDRRTAGAGGGDESMCCVCMVRNKGAAFIPCGHTFCRLCTRELWVSRGTCPLCNGFILEILDIF